MGVRLVLAPFLALDILLLCSGFGSKRFALTRDCSANPNSSLGFDLCFRLGFGSHVASAQVLPWRLALALVLALTIALALALALALSP